MANKVEEKTLDPIEQLKRFAKQVEPKPKVKPREQTPEGSNTPERERHFTKTCLSITTADSREDGVALRWNLHYDGVDRLTATISDGSTPDGRELFSAQFSKYTTWKRFTRDIGAYLQAASEEKPLAGEAPALSHINPKAFDTKLESELLLCTPTETSLQIWEISNLRTKNRSLCDVQFDSKSQMKSFIGFLSDSLLKGESAESIAGFEKLLTSVKFRISNGRKWSKK